MHHRVLRCVISMRRNKGTLRSHRRSTGSSPGAFDLSLGLEITTAHVAQSEGTKRPRNASPERLVFGALEPRMLMAGPLSKVEVPDGSRLRSPLVGHDGRVFGRYLRQERPGNVVVGADAGRTEGLRLGQYKDELWP